MKPIDDYIERSQILFSIGHELSQSFEGIVAPNRRMALTTHFLSRILESYMTLVSIQAERSKLSYYSRLFFSSINS
jgi:hypothetical protein